MKQKLNITAQQFTLKEMQVAHTKVKTGLDFPGYIREIKSLGLITYEYLVKDGSVLYRGAKDHEVQGRGAYDSLAICKKADPDALRNAIAIHQQGRTDFMTFCKQAADAGVEKWIIDTVSMACNYIDLKGNLMVAEPIPVSY